MNLRRVVPPAALPVTVDEVKAHLRVTGPADDTLIGALIEAAVSYLDGWTGTLGRALVEQTWELAVDEFPSGDGIRLPLGDLITVVSVTYDDEDGMPQTLDPLAYSVDTYSPDGWVVLNEGSAWPTILDAINAVRVRFTVGYGAPADVPAAIRQAIIMMVGGLYASAKSDGGLKREIVEGIGTKEWDTTGGLEAANTRVVEMLLRPFRKMTV
jgi:uncharacterized phiE125 gp8 family phage protein